MLLAAGAAAVAVAVVIAVLVAGGGGEGSRVAKVATTPVVNTATTTTDATLSGAGPIPGHRLAVYSSLPEQGASAAQAEAIENGERLALKEAGGKVAGYSVAYHALDDSLASTGAADPGATARNARRAASDETAVGYLGEYNSGASQISIPILNDAGIAQVSPSNTYVGLTTNDPGSEPGEPAKYYPTGERTYARVVPRDTVQAAALATAADEAGCKSVHVWSSGTVYSDGLARNFETSASDLGLSVEGREAVSPTAASYRRQAANVHADCFVYTGEYESNGTQAMTDAASAAGVTSLFAGDGMCLNQAADPRLGLPAKVAPRFRCTIATLDPKALGPAGKRFFANYAEEYGDPAPDPYALYGYESMSLLLDAVARAGREGAVSRRNTVKQLLATKNRESALGTYSIDKNGDTTLRDYGLYKIAGRQLVFDRVLAPPG
jgi:branched-chain amino acid transport system substrate-binding protein